MSTPEGIMIQHDQQCCEHNLRHICLDKQYMLHDKSMDLHSLHCTKKCYAALSVFAQCFLGCIAGLLLNSLFASLHGCQPWGKEANKLVREALQCSLESTARILIVLCSAAVLRSTSSLDSLSQAQAPRQTLYTNPNDTSTSA